MNDDTDFRDYDFSREEYNSFLSTLREKDKNEIDAILLRYSLYKPEMAEAALDVAAEKGMITTDLKAKLAEYIRINFSHIAEGARELRWARSNAFKDYVRMYSSDRIFDILEDRSDIVKDVYRAVLDIAVERSLVEQGEADRLYRDLRNSEKTYFQRRREIRDEVINDIFFSTEKVTEKHVQVESDDYWKCPSCGEEVGMNLERCWNCEALIPENPEHPVKEEVVKEVKTYREPRTPTRIGLSFLVLGALVIFYNYLRRLSHGYSFDDFLGYRPAEIIFGVIGIGAGVLVLIYSAFSKSRR